MLHLFGRVSLIQKIRLVKMAAIFVFVGRAVSSLRANTFCLWVNRTGACQAFAQYSIGENEQINEFIKT